MIKKQHIKTKIVNPISEGGDMNNIESLTSLVQQLNASVTLWNDLRYFCVGATALFTVLSFLTFWVSGNKATLLSENKDRLQTLLTNKAKTESEEKITSVKADAEKQIALLNAEALNAKSEIAEAKLETEKLRDKNLSLEMAVSPRILEQRLTGESLKSFANAEVSVISLPDFEPRRTAGQIRFMLRSIAGWKKFSGSLPHPMAFFDGVVIHVGMSEYARAVAEVLVSVLNNNGIVARRGYPVLELGDNGVLVVVGPKPLPKELDLKPENVPADKHGNRMWGNILEE